MYRTIKYKRDILAPTHLSVHAISLLISDTNPSIFFLYIAPTVANILQRIRVFNTGEYWATITHKKFVLVENGPMRIIMGEGNESVKHL